VVHVVLEERACGCSGTLDLSGGKRSAAVSGQYPVMGLSFRCLMELVSLATVTTRAVSGKKRNGGITSCTSEERG